MEERERAARMPPSTYQQPLQTDTIQPTQQLYAQQQQDRQPPTYQQQHMHPQARYVGWMQLEG